jgi:hypothetical protein
MKAATAAAGSGVTVVDATAAAGTWSVAVDGGGAVVVLVVDGDASGVVAGSTTVLCSTAWLVAGGSVVSDCALAGIGDLGSIVADDAVDDDDDDDDDLEDLEDLTNPPPVEVFLEFANGLLVRGIAADTGRAAPLDALVKVEGFSGVVSRRLARRSDELDDEDDAGGAAMVTVGVGVAAGAGAGVGAGVAVPGGSDSEAASHSAISSALTPTSGEIPLPPTYEKPAKCRPPVGCAARPLAAFLGCSVWSGLIPSAPNDWRACCAVSILGSTGGTSSLRYTASQSTPAKNAWFLTSLMPPSPHPRRSLVLRFKSCAKKSGGSKRACQCVAGHGWALHGLHTLVIKSLASSVSNSSSILIGSLMILSNNSLLFSDQNGGCMHDERRCECLLRARGR